MNTVSLRLYTFAKAELKLSDDKAKEFIDLLGEASDKDFLTQKDKNELITRIDSVKTDINGNIWKAVAFLATVSGICTALIIHFK